jgi:hypothetical protein
MKQYAPKPHKPKELMTMNMHNYMCQPIETNREKYASIVYNLTEYKDICLELHQLTLMVTMNQQGEIIAIAQYGGTAKPRYYVHKSLQGVAK